MSHVIGLFETRPAANAAIHKLRDAGVEDNAISVALREDETTAAGPSFAEAAGVHDLTTEGAEVGAVSGAAVGTLVGLLVAGSTFAFPGVGTFLIAGPLVAALTGAGVGAASGGLFGALVGSGIPESDAGTFVSGVEAGQVVVVAHVPEELSAEARRIMDEEGSRRTQES